MVIVTVDLDIEVCASGKGVDGNFCEYVFSGN